MVYEYPAGNLALEKYISALYTIGVKNFTYSISLRTNEKNVISLHLSTGNIKTSFAKHSASAILTSEGDVPGNYDKVVNIDPKVKYNNFDSVFEIIPDQATNLDIKCIDTNNCKIINTFVWISKFPDDNQIKSVCRVNFLDFNNIILPDKNFTGINLYYYNQSAQTFVKVPHTED